MKYSTNVFINCPFDDGYRDILERLVFVLSFYGFTTYLSTNRSSAHDRLDEITKLIRKSKYTFHDLSRHDAGSGNKQPRFNMPFELGIDFGCYKYDRNRGDKVIAILDKEPHDYDRYLSDMSGRDILYHKNEPELIFRIIPFWLTSSTGKVYDSPKKIAGYYAEWINDYRRTLKAKGHDLRSIRQIPIHVQQTLLTAWLPVWKKASGYINT